jgi:hypothetical protein
MLYAAQSEHVNEDSLELYLKSQLEEESTSAVEAHLVECEDCVTKLAEQDKYLWCLAELHGERRRYPRVATDEAASVQILNPFSVDVWDVRIVDVSEGGLRIYTPHPLPTESLIRIRMQHSVACGDVRHCTPADNWFYAGIRLHDYFLAR